MLIKDIYNKNHIKFQKKYLPLLFMSGIISTILLKKE
jgi:hypothetical protein